MGMTKKSCEQCGETFSARTTRTRYCSHRCAALAQHARGAARQVGGAEHYAWKADLTDYKSIHCRVYRARGKASTCELRGDVGCVSEVFEWAQVHDTDPLDVQNYRALCKPCHTTYDNQRGSGHARAVFTDEQVAVIRRRYEAGDISQQALADELGVAQATISRAVRRVSYMGAD